MSGPVIALLAFPRVTQLDLTGPYEVFSRLPGARVELAWKSLEPVRSDTGLGLLPTVTLADCPQADVIVVPGGPGQQDLMEDAAVLGFLRAQAAGAGWVMSVCTGSLVLGAAGLLAGRRAACHWLSLPLIAELGGIPADERVVFDGRLCSTAGVSAGIDGALALVAAMAGREAAERIQLGIEYDPHPPFAAGHPRSAPPAVIAQLRSMAAAMIAARTASVRAAAARLAEDKA